MLWLDLTKFGRSEKDSQRSCVEEHNFSHVPALLMRVKGAWGAKTFVSTCCYSTIAYRRSDSSWSVCVEVFRAKKTEQKWGVAVTWPGLSRDSILGESTSKTKRGHGKVQLNKIIIESLDFRQILMYLFKYIGPNLTFSYTGVCLTSYSQENREKNKNKNPVWNIHQSLLCKYSHLGIPVYQCNVTECGFGKWWELFLSLSLSLLFIEIIDINFILTIISLELQCTTALPLTSEVDMEC